MDRLATLVGGSGFLGTAVTEQLVRAGWRVRVLCRNPNRAQRLKTMGEVGQVAIVRGDVRVPATLAAAMAGADAAIYLVGILDEKGGQKFADVQARGAGAAAAAAKAAGVGAFVHVSAIGADAASPSAYGRTKAEGEALVRAAFPEAAIVRPSLVFGAEDGFTNRFAKLIGLGPVMPVVAGDTKFQPVFVGDVARAILAALDRPGETFELGGPQVMTMREIMAFIARETGQEKSMVEVPDAGARLMASFGFLPGAPMTMDQYRMLQKDNVVAAGAAGLEALGIAGVPLSAVAGDWLSRYRRGGRFATGNA